MTGGIILTVAGAVMFFIAYLLYYRKAYRVISGLNFSSREEVAERYDLDGMTRHFGIMAAIIGVLLLLAGIAAWAGFELLVVLLPFLLFLIIPFFMFGSERYIKVGRKGQRTVNIVTTALLLVIAAFILFMLWSGSKAPSIYIADNKLIISAMYGTEVPLGSITQVDRVNLAGRKVSKTNGFNLGDNRKGHFRVEGLGDVLLFQQAAPGDTLLIKTAERTILINMGGGAANDEIERLIRTK